MTDLNLMGQAARTASRQLATLNNGRKNAALLAIADEIEARPRTILAQNALDIADGRAKGLSDALLDRLLLNEKRIAALADDTRHVVDLPDPVGAEYRGPRAAQRHAPAQAAHPHRRDRRDLRGAAERDHRRGHALPEDRQRRDPARRQRDAAQQPGAGRGDPGRRWRASGCRRPRCNTSPIPTARW